MNVDALTSAPQPIPMHATAAIGAILLGALQFVLPKGTLSHRLLGYVWISGMLTVSLSSFFINEFRWLGPFGPIHLLSLFVLWSLWRGVRFAKLGEVSAHRSLMIALYWQSLLLAGAFTLLPGRIMHAVVFG